MADLCGGHPADVLIAVCLVAQTLTVPGMERWPCCLVDRLEGKGDPYCLGLSWAGDRAAGEGR